MPILTFSFFTSGKSVFSKYLLIGFLDVERRGPVGKHHLVALVFRRLTKQLIQAARE